MTLGKLLYVSEPHCVNLKNEDKNITTSTGVPQGALQCMRSRVVGALGLGVVPAPSSWPRIPQILVQVLASPHPGCSSLSRFLPICGLQFPGAPWGTVTPAPVERRTWGCPILHRCSTLPMQAWPGSCRGWPLRA